MFIPVALLSGLVGSRYKRFKQFELTIAIVAAVVPGASLCARVQPAGFIPEQDQVIFGVNVQLPPGAPIERTSVVMKKIEDILAKAEAEGLDSHQTLGGSRAVTSTFQSNCGTIFVRMKAGPRKVAHAQGSGERLALGAVVVAGRRVCQRLQR